MRMVADATAVGMGRGARRTWPCLVLAAGMAIVGCGQEGRSGPDYPVHGKVVLDSGKPLERGHITFVSDATALSYAGTIGPDGGFELKQGDRNGAPAGTYKVRVEIDETGLKAKGKSTALPFAGKYRDEDSSKLTATVEAKPENSFEFKLVK